MARPQSADPQKRKKETARATGRLMRAGFSAGAIYKVLREWDTELEECDLPDPEDVEVTDTE
jgi:regulatory protein